MSASQAAGDRAVVQGLPGPSRGLALGRRVLRAAARLLVGKRLLPGGPRALRPRTMDGDIWHSVVGHNEYRLPRRFRPTDIVLDIGAHIGAFSYAALTRGAGRVYAYEPHAGNVELAECNLQHFA